MVSRAVCFAVSIGLLSAYAHAHHSFAVFDLGKRIELRGEVVEFKLRSPHSSFVVNARVFVEGEPRGGVETWRIESDALAILRTIGIDVQTFQPNDAITIMAAPTREPDVRFAHAFVLIAADGTRYSRESSNRIFSPSLRPGGTAARGAPGEQVVAAGSEARGIDRMSGRWQQPRAVTVGPESALPLNEAGKAAWRSYDPKLSPANTCEPMSIPDVFLAPFYLFDIRLVEQRAVLHNEAYDIRRTVSLDGKAAPADPRNQFGIVSGRIEGEVLILDSRGYPPSKWGLGAAAQSLGGDADVPSSEQKTVTERYSVSEDGTTLVLEFTLHDPMYMTHPYTSKVELTRVPEATEMYPYECDVESASMWSRGRDADPSSTRTRDPR
jgi:hypothetical protein